MPNTCLRNINLKELRKTQDLNNKRKRSKAKKVSEPAATIKKASSGTSGTQTTLRRHRAAKNRQVFNIIYTEEALNKDSQKARTSPEQLKQPQQTERRMSALISGSAGPHTTVSSDMENSSPTHIASNTDSTSIFAAKNKAK
jgi:hypothetical protein